MPTDGDLLLKAILENPAEDTPRLVYADWLEEQGQGERAAFIREAVQYPHCEFVRLTGGDPFQLLGIPEPGRGVVVGPPSDDPLVNDANRRTWMWGETEDFGCVVHDMVRELDYRVDRGFVCGVRCKSEAWLKWADALTAAHPVERVTLTTPVRGEHLPLSFYRDPFPHWQAVDAVLDEYNRLVDNRGLPLFVPDRVQWAGVFGRRWPGVAFELPPD